MKKTLLSQLVAAIFGSGAIARGRAFTCDAAFAFRMGAGFPGDVNRTHPVSIEPALQSNTPVANYGFPCVVAGDGTNGVRPFAAGDGALTTLYGVTVRPFPQQASSGSAFGAAAFGSATPPAVGEIDVVRQGYVTVQLPSDAPTAAKGGAVFIWIAASAGTHTQGGFESVASGGNTIALAATRYMFNGPQDASGFAELVITS